MEKVKTIAVNAAFIALLGIVLVWGVTLYRQHSQYEKGEQGVATGNYLVAVSGYESAIHMYTPLSPVVGRSAQKLWELGEMALKAGDQARALIAFRALRSSFYAVDGLYAPGQDWISKCDARIAQIVKAQQPR
jgi:hypothetical protein